MLQLSIEIKSIITIEEIFNQEVEEIIEEEVIEYKILIDLKMINLVKIIKNQMKILYT